MQEQFFTYINIQFRYFSLLHILKLTDMIQLNLQFQSHTDSSCSPQDGILVMPLSKVADLSFLSVILAGSVVRCVWVLLF